jgi:hypothetical protein
VSVLKNALGLQVEHAVEASVTFRDTTATFEDSPPVFGVIAASIARVVMP